MLTVIVVSAISVFTMLSMVARFHSKAFAVMRGHNAMVDLIFTLGFGAFAAISGSLMGLLISVTTGLFLSLTLIFTTRYMGGAKIRNSNFKWLNPMTWFKFKLEYFEPSHKLPAIVGKYVNFNVNHSVA